MSPGFYGKAKVCGFSGWDYGYPLGRMSYKNASDGFWFLTVTFRTNMNPTILVVEDNGGEQYLLRVLLERFDYNVEIMPSAEKAIEYFSSHRNFAAILVDLTLPGMDGCECVRILRQLEAGERKIPIIALTARTEPEDRKNALAAGMDDYLQKPFEPEELRRLLLRYVYDSSKPNLKTLKPYQADDVS